MNLSKSFLASLVLHLFLIAVAWGAFNALRKKPATETKIRVALLLQSPTASRSTPQPIVTPQPPVVAAKTPEKTTVPLKPIEAPKPVQTASAPVSVPKPASAPAAMPHTEPAVAKTPPSEPAIAKAPPPPPAPAIQADYEEANLGRIRTLLSERLKYPKNALRLRQQGNVIITFTLSPSGDVSGVIITKSSDFEMLDDAARTLIETTAPAFPKPPKSVRISVPIEYKIR